jgi:hypothetical protein
MKRDFSSAVLLIVCAALSSAASAQSSAPSSGAGTPGVRPGSGAGTLGSAPPGNQSINAAPPGSSGTGGAYGGFKGGSMSANTPPKQSLGSLADRNGEISRDRFLRFMADQYDAIARERRGSVSTGDVRKLLKDASAN